MKDTSIKGNGKSSIIRAPSDMPATFEEWRSQLLEGKGYLDIGLNTELGDNAGCDIIGTPLNKSNLLSDTTKSSLQLNGEDPTVNDALLKLSSIRAQPNGIATLDGSGKLAQMPTAADVGAMPSMLTDIIYVEGFQTVDHYDNLDNYITPGQRVHIATSVSAASTDNCPERSPGILEVSEYNHSVKTSQILSIVQRYTAQNSGNTYTRVCELDGAVWSNWQSPVACSDPSDGNMCINFGGGMHICAGSQTWTNISIGNATQGVYASQTLFFDDFKRAFAYAPKCLIGMSVGAGGPYWLTLSSDGPTTARPQGFKLMSTTQFTVSTITMSYIAIGIS